MDSVSPEKIRERPDFQENRLTKGRETAVTASLHCLLEVYKISTRRSATTNVDPPTKIMSSGAASSRASR